MATVHLLITGKVQGVFYRATARDMAVKLGISGWVKNTKEGYVEATASGSEEAVRAFIDWCWQGPPKAEVTDVRVTPKPDNGLAGFQIIR